MSRSPLLSLSFLLLVSLPAAEPLPEAASVKFAPAAEFWSKTVEDPEEGSRWRALLEAAGLEVDEIEPDEEGCLAMSLRLAAAHDPETREVELRAYVLPRRTADDLRELRVLVRLCHGDPDAPAGAFRERALAANGRILFLSHVEREPLGEHPGAFRGFGQTLTVSLARPDLLRRAMEGVAQDIAILLSLRTESGRPILVPGERLGAAWTEAQSVRLADESRWRAEKGAAVADYAPGRPLGDDPLCHPSLLLDRRFLGDLPPAGLAAALGYGMVEDPLAGLPSRRALRLLLENLPAGPEKAAAALAPLAGNPDDPLSVQPVPMALHAWSRLMAAKSMDPLARLADTRRSLLELRASALLGYDFAIQLYDAFLREGSHLGLPEEALHAEDREGWSALVHLANDRERAFLVESRYRAGVAHPVEIGAAAGGRDPAAARRILARMNAARAARGWVPLALVEPFGPRPAVAPSPMSAVAAGDADLTRLSSLLSGAGLEVAVVGRGEDGGLCAEVLLGSASDSRVRDIPVLVKVEPVGRVWRLRLRLCLVGGETEYGHEDYAHHVRACAPDWLLLRHGRVVGNGPHDPDAAILSLIRGEAVISHLNASVHVDPADPGVLRSFLSELEAELAPLMGARSERGRPVFITPKEVVRLNVDAFADDLARRRALRAREGWDPADCVEGSALGDDPASLAANPSLPGQVDHLLHFGPLPEVDRALARDGLAHLPARRALRLALRLGGHTADAAAEAELRALAYDPSGGKPRDAWALALYGEILVRRGSHPGHPDRQALIGGLDALRESARLGCEYGLDSYVAAMRWNRPVPGGEDHWRSLDRWMSLCRHFGTVSDEELAESERGYRAGDWSPFLLPAPDDAEFLELLKDTLEEVNRTRRARGWRLFALRPESPAAE